MGIQIRPVSAPRDGEALWQLYQHELGSIWPCPREAVAALPGKGFVAEESGGVIGACLVADSSLELLVVDRAHQRMGVGTQLLERAEQLVGHQLQLGGGHGYLWPGLPGNLAAAKEFLDARGYRMGEPCWDLTRSLVNFEVPPGALSVNGTAAISYRLADRSLLAKAITFEAQQFPQWAPYFQTVRGPENVVVAVDNGQAVAGALLVQYPGEPVALKGLLGPGCSTIAAVGVDPGHRKLGIGTGLVAFAAEVLRDAGAEQCLIGWTNLLTFYGRLGFMPWMAYHRERTPLPAVHVRTRQAAAELG
jgi:GNAT superfamily N-acetyltransferase